MKKALFPQSIVLAGISLFACLGFVAAQSSPIDKPVFPNVSLDVSQLRIVNFRERELGWVSGRIYDITSDEPVQPSIADVKIILRSSEAGFETFVREQVSGETGVFDFQNLGAGEYTVEIDRASLPAKYRLNSETPAQVSVKPLNRSYVNLPIVPQRVITGVVFVDIDGDGRYSEGKDSPVVGASIAANGAFAQSDVNGSYMLRDLPAGRIGLLVSVPLRADTTHVVLDMGTGPVTNRVVNVPMNR